MDRIQYFISEKEKKKMEELNTMEQQTEEATTVIDEVTESIGENEPRNRSPQPDTSAYARIGSPIAQRSHLWLS